MHADRQGLFDDDGQTEPDERRWHAGSFVALGYAIFMAIFNIGLVLVVGSLPSDGWLIVTSRDLPGEAVEIGPEFLAIGADLRPGDEVVAVNGESISTIGDRAYDFLNLDPPDWPDGTVLRYEVRRDGIMRTIDAPIRRISARDYVSIAWESAGARPLQRVVAVAGPLSFFAIGLAVFLLRPGSRAAHALFLIGSAFIFNLMPTLTGLPSAFYPLPPSSMPFDSWTAVIIPSLMYLALVFPRPKWLLRRFPRGGVVLLYLPWLLVFNVNYLLHPGDRTGYNQTNQTIYIVEIALLMVITFASLIHTALTVRDPVARSQFKWLSLGLIGFVGFGIGGWLLGYLISDMTNPIFQVAQVVGQLGWFLLPVCLAVAITRYRLFDIDVIIRRTTSYAIITGVLALVYLGSVVVLQRLFGQLTGQNSTAAVVLSTLLIAALFLPVRRRVQNVIDRRFNRTRYNAEKTLERFAATVRDETDLDELTAELVRVIEETMQPDHVSVWLRPASDRPQTTDHRQM